MKPFLKIPIMIPGLILFLLFLCPSASSAPTVRLSENESRTLASLKKIDNFPLYEMHYFGDYGFNAFLRTGIRHYRSHLLPHKYKNKKWACTCFASLNKNGNRLFGRNFDWYPHPALLLFTNPPEGYASVSMVDIFYLGFSKDKAPAQAQQRRLLEAPYLGQKRIYFAMKGF